MNDFEKYRSIPAVNFSTLKHMAVSPLHYQYRLTHPPVETAAMLLGRAVHCAVLEPDQFPRRYVVFEGARRAGSGWADFQKANANRTPLKESEYAQCLAVRDAVRNDKWAGPLLEGGCAEVPFTWTDKATGIDCKARLDYLRPGGITELKTTNSIDARLFGTLAARMKYHVQAAFYNLGASAQQNGVSPGPVKIIAVEQEPPWDVGVFVVDDDALYCGETEALGLLRRVKYCQDHNEWPGRFNGEQELELPRWLVTEEDES